MFHILLPGGVCTNSVWYVPAGGALPGSPGWHLLGVLAWPGSEAGSGSEELGASSGLVEE